MKNKYKEGDIVNCCAVHAQCYGKPIQYVDDAFYRVAGELFRECDIRLTHEAWIPKAHVAGTIIGFNTTSIQLQ